ncbi:hypothetical protein ACLIA0_07605 [Bacillaceae bacterium W0354]
MKSILRAVEGVSDRAKNFWDKIKEVDYKAQLLKMKDLPVEVYYKNIPSVIILLMSFIYMVGIEKTPSAGWIIFFMIAFFYAIFATYYWKKDQQFNLHLSLVLLIMTFSLVGYTTFIMIMEKVIAFKLIYYLF